MLHYCVSLDNIIFAVFFYSFIVLNDTNNVQLLSEESPLDVQYDILMLLRLKFQRCRYSKQETSVNS